MSDPQKDDMNRIIRLCHAYDEPPIVNHKPMSRDDMQELRYFIETLADNMYETIQGRDRDVTIGYVRKVLMASSKWSLEKFAR